MPSNTPLTDAINALTQYANETTGASDTTLSDAVGTLVAGYGGGGGSSEWQLLHDSTTTEDGNLQIALTNISVKEVKIYAIEPANYTSSVVVYCPLNNSGGNHYDSGYGRPMISLSNSGSSQKIIMAGQEPVIIDGWVENPSYSVNNGNQSALQVKAGTASRVTAGMTFTSMSIATYQSVPAGLRIVAFGR